MKLRKWLIGLAAVLTVLAGGAYLFLSSLQMFATTPVYQTKNGALDGYDPVAYFTKSEPTKGRDDVTVDWNGAVWHFASADNRDLFQQQPERYAPRCGGYCAYAVANGYTAKTDPDAWKIVDGRLYLNFDQGTSEKWQGSRAMFIKQANENWPRVIDD